MFELGHTVHRYVTTLDTLFLVHVLANIMHEFYRKDAKDRYDNVVFIDLNQNGRC